MVATKHYILESICAATAEAMAGATAEAMAGATAGATAATGAAATATAGAATARRRQRERRQLREAWRCDAHATLENRGRRPKMAVAAMNSIQKRNETHAP